MLTWLGTVLVVLIKLPHPAKEPCLGMVRKFSLKTRKAKSPLEGSIPQQICRGGT